MEAHPSHYPPVAVKGGSRSYLIPLKKGRLKIFLPALPFKGEERKGRGRKKESELSIQRRFVSL